MKSVYVTAPGGLDALRFGDLPDPVPEDGEILIKVKACGVNRVDVFFREYTEQLEQPHVVGSEVAGVVESVHGESVLTERDEVVVNPSIPCRRCARCRAGEPCERVGIFGYDTLGGYAELVAVPTDQVYRKPRELSFVEAAAFPLTYLTAWHMLTDRAQLKKGESVFIWGAAGGLGSAGVDIARHLGAKVIAAARSPAVGQRLLEIGADHVVTYEDVDAVEAVKDLTSGRGVDVVFESVGAATWDRTLGMLAIGGRVVIAGTTSGDVASQDLSQLYYRQLSIIGSEMGTVEEFETVVGLVSEGSLHPVVDRVYPLSEAREAQRRMEKREHVGKIVLQMD